MIQILFLAANPTDEDKLELENEFQSIDNVLKRSRFKKQFKLAKKTSITISQIQESLLKFEPQVVHFSGHGGEESTLVFVDEDGEGVEVPPNALTELFSIVNRDKYIHCVILNSCYSAKQAKAISRHVPCVIGNTEPIYDDTATIFATGFYRALSFGQSIKSAYDLGRNALKLENIHEGSIIKLLHRRSINPGKIYLVKKSEIPSEISSESNLENHIHVLLEDPKFKGRNVETIADTYEITKSKAVKILKKLGAVRIVSEKDPKKRDREYWGIISHVINVHFARSDLTYINIKYLRGNFKDKNKEEFQKEFEKVLKSICRQHHTKKNLWKLK